MHVSEIKAVGYVAVDGQGNIKGFGADADEASRSSLATEHDRDALDTFPVTHACVNDADFEPHFVRGVAVSVDEYRSLTGLTEAEDATRRIALL